RTHWLRRSGLPAPFQLGPSVARYGHLGPSDRLRVGYGALRLARLAPGRRDLAAPTLAGWLVSHGQSEQAVQRLWALIALPARCCHRPPASTGPASAGWGPRRSSTSTSCTTGPS